MPEHIHFIINPGAAKKEPILSLINQAFHDRDIHWDVSVTRKDHDVQEIARSLIGKTELIAVYGGDGCVMQAAQVLSGTDTPMTIIPAGTANVMAKELGIPTDSLEALEMLFKDDSRKVKIDMGTVNGTPFLIRVNLGIMADMILEADRELKNQLGQLAYGVTAIQSLSKAVPVHYMLTIDGERIQEEGISLTVTNSGSIGFGSYKLFPGISVTDGYLDVVLMNEASISALLKVAGTTLLQTGSEILKHWKCREVRIELQEEHKFICDDTAMSASDLLIKVVPGSLTMLVPAETATTLVDTSPESELSKPA